MKSIFFPVYWDQGFETRLEIAIGLAEQHEATLVLASTEPATVLARGMGCVLSETRDRQHRITADIVASVREHLAGHSVKHIWRHVEGFDAKTLSAAARLSDLQVVPATWSVSEPQSPRPSELINRCSPPALAVSAGATFPTGDHGVLVAWDDSAPAIAALRASVPLLKRAGKVTVLTVGDRAAASPSDPVDYLSWHGIAADVGTRAKDGDVSQTLLRVAADEGYGLLVMGAYGWGRWAEELFGGVTESVLERTTVPVLLTRC